MTITRRNLLALSVSAAILGLAGCASPGLGSGPSISGVVAIGGPLANATVTVVDARGVKKTAVADAKGAYAINAEGLSAPLLISAIEAGSNTNCRYNATLRARCLSSVLTSLGAGSNVANINPITDRIVSDVAVQLKFIGPQQLVDSGKTAGITPEAVAAAKKTSMAGFGAALKAAGVDDVEKFDAVSTPMAANRQGVDAVLEVVNHNRNYDNPTSESAYTVLTDISFRPIVGLNGSGPYEPLDFARAQRELAAIKSAKVRVLVVGDSTAATYELQRLPRMGWGQVFENEFKVDAGVKVLNAARAGRSSKDFYMGAWYQQMARFMQPGDLVLINHGHNDQNCDSTKKDRGPADVAGLCSYPNDVNGKSQFPVGKPEMSFQKSLERYIELARAAGAMPVMLTPTTRVWNKDRKPGFPVVPQHMTSQNATQGFAFIGDYSRTVKDTATANSVPLIDLEAKTIAFANAHEKDWKDYWLAVGDFKTWPWYATQSAGTFDKPDTTHFQQKGAEAVAGMVAQGIKETPALKAWAALLK
ncbi:GDSL-type esterase/lipase family protein [Uliginosibacterium sp. 31-16]|uniref:GDSL-type esterase/lipase family protein n=1 Tax=Uliginosibacterium sp. 31-16 TaxID=3068315 RepID=UPI00273D6EFA|nr:GDSL-type esterase/lipase family protein [Uliginosibacterium sp. 31-16]MDP5240701.1 GDSL-type esterase/lipase family protein [Uliginosibacterium sp. 31-16]